METKTCPYCGETILSTAKKCKHCGEWFEIPETTESEPEPEPAEESVPEAEEQEMVDSDPVDTKSLGKLCWSAMSFELLTTGDWIKDYFRGGSNYYKEMVGSIILGLMWVFILVGLRRFCRERQLPKTPLIILIGLTSAGCFLDLMDLSVDLESDEGILLYYLLISLPYFLAYCVIEFIIGLKFYSNTITRMLGILFMVGGALALLLDIISWNFDDGFDLFSTVVNTILSIAILYLIKRLVTNTEE